MGAARVAFLAPHASVASRQPYPQTESAVSDKGIRLFVVFLFPSSERKVLLLAKQPFKKRLAAYLKMRGYIDENGGEGADTKRRMLGDREMMLTMLMRGESKMTACLAGNRVAELVKGLSEIAPGQIAGKPHTAITSSRTW